MLELVQKFEQLAVWFNPGLLVGSGLLCLLAGLFVWLGGLGFRVLLVGIAGVVAGGICGVFIAAQSVPLVIILAVAGCGAAILLERVFISILTAALAKMQQANSSYMMVGGDGALEGIVSKSDLTGAFSPYLRPVFAKWRRSLDDATLQIKIKWIMSRSVRTVKPETSLSAVIGNMCQFGGCALPVVDKEGKVQGLVTIFDILQALLSDKGDFPTVGKTAQSPSPA